ncbi:MAG: ImmA/IrrE family metallo-endopeptidase [Candidatus Bathyarchaeia archaeon]
MMGKKAIIVVSQVEESAEKANEEIKKEMISKMMHASWRKEMEGEISAAYLLIPEEKLNRILKEEWVKDSPDPIPVLSEEFQVSENFMRERLEFEKTII